MLALLITIGEAVAYVISGMYGPISEIGAGKAFHFYKIERYKKKNKRSFRVQV